VEGSGIKSVTKKRQSDTGKSSKDQLPQFLRLKATYFGCAQKIFASGELTQDFYAVIIVGFALESGDFCPAEALQVVCGVDDGPKTDWLVVCLAAIGPPVQVGNKFK